LIKIVGVWNKLIDERSVRVKGRTDHGGCTKADAHRYGDPLV